MPLTIIRQDITQINCDAIVASTDPQYSHSGGEDAAIHKAAGAELYAACLKHGTLRVGTAVITPGFALPCKYVIHTVGPRWRGGENGEEILLRSCYAEVLRLAEENQCKSIAIPLISSGRFRFPRTMVMKIATDEIGKFLENSEMRVYLVVYDKNAYLISRKVRLGIASLLNEEEGFLCEQGDAPLSRRKRLSVAEESVILPALSLEEMMKQMDKGFADTLFDYIDRRGMTDVECYKRANVDKKTFSKIKCVKNYRPSKITVVSFAIALRLDIEETGHLLNTVGMSLSRSNLFDVIIEYFITTGNYRDIHDVNATLHQFDQATLGV